MFTKCLDLLQITSIKQRYKASRYTYDVTSSQQHNILAYTNSMQRQCERPETVIEHVYYSGQ